MNIPYVIYFSSLNPPTILKNAFRAEDCPQAFGGKTYDELKAGCTYFELPDGMSYPSQSIYPEKLKAGDVLALKDVGFYVLPTDLWLTYVQLVDVSTGIADWGETQQFLLDSTLQYSPLEPGLTSYQEEIDGSVLGGNFEWQSIIHRQTNVESLVFSRVLTYLSEGTLNTCAFAQKYLFLHIHSENTINLSCYTYNVLNSPRNYVYNGFAQPCYNGGGVFTHPTFRWYTRSWAYSRPGRHTTIFYTTFPYQTERILRPYKKIYKCVSAVPALAGIGLLAGLLMLGGAGGAPAPGRYPKG
jgi:hypothetical protein